MKGGLFKKLRKGRVFVSLYLIATILIGSFGDGLISTTVPVAEAVQSSIDTNAATLGTSHLMSGSQTVFVSDQTGYKFFRDSLGYCVYRKTTNGGTSWSATTTVDAQPDCFQIQVWYDQWTPGDTGSYIHIATLDANPDDAWYNRLDTADDTLLMGSAPVSVATAQGGTLAEGANSVSITKGTDGTVYISSVDASDSYVVECSSSCWLAGSWTETGTNPFGLTNNYALLAPLPNGNILAIHRDVGLEDMGSKVWNNGAGTWDAATTTFDFGAPDNTTYDVGMAFTVSPTTADIYLAYIASSTALGADDQIRTAIYSGGVWTRKKEVVRYTDDGITNVAIALDSSNDDVYVAYSARTTPGALATGNIYWKKSVDDMTSWTYKQGPVNTSPNDFYGVDLNVLSSERIFATWFDDTNDDILGDTITDIFQGVRVATVAQDEGNISDSYTQVTIDPDAQAAGTSHLKSGSQTVFVSDQTGYKFFRDAGGYCVYRKTTNGGTSWSATTTVDAQTDCIAISVWYDQWTPGSASTSIHIATLDTTAGDVFYNRLNTNDDTFLIPTGPTSTSLSQGGTIVAGANQVSITRGTDGTIYVSSIDNSDSYVQECTSTCNRASSWTETGTNPFGLTNNYALLAPLPNGNILAIHRDVGLEDMGSKVWNNGAGTWDAATTTFDFGAPDNTTYDVGMAFTVSTTTGDIYLAYIASSTALGADDQIRTAIYSGGVWTAKTIVSSSTVIGLTNVAIALDSSNDDVYVAYSAQATAGALGTGNILFKKSTNGMVNWGYEQGPVNTSPNDFYGVDLNVLSSERIFATWFDDTRDDVYGATIVDLPSTASAVLSSQITSVSASSSQVYIGGAFSISDTNDTQSFNVTGITITESGTINAETDIKNVRLLYEADTSLPYDCASQAYDGNESQFGSINYNGFSGANGETSFSGTTLGITPTRAYCLYVVFDVLNTASNNATIEIAIQNPATDVVVTGNTAGPTTEQAIPGSTLVYNDVPTLSHYHWRNDDGSETTATSKTGSVEDTPLLSLQKGGGTRLRIGVSNEGGSSTPAMQYRLEYAESGASCADVTNWTDVGSSGGHFDMYDSSNLLEASTTTNVLLASLGAISDENTEFLTSNGGVKDTSSQTGNITLTATQFVELEYSIIASSSATDGGSYCFRVTDAGNALSAYTNYPRASISADVAVNIATSSQAATTTLPAVNFYVGSAFVISNNSTARDVTSITISELGTVDAETDVKNIGLYYDLDTSAPYDCASESYTNGAIKYGATSTSGFSSANGTSTFTGSVNISTTASMCVYTVLSTTQGALNGETIDIVIENPSQNVVVSGGGVVSPTVTRDMNGSTSLVGALLTQTHYHFRRDNGGEVTASSSSNGVEDTPIANISQTTTVRVRLQVSNESTTTASESTGFRLEYGTKVTSCSAVDSWIDVGGAGGAWDMATTTNLTEGGDTTNIATSSGGVTDENTTFLTPNSAIKESSSQVASTTLTTTQFIEPEFSIKQTTSAGYNTTYCFRLSAGGSVLSNYLRYPELTTSPERDFEIQRGTATIANRSTSTILTAGVDYIAPVASTSAFIRITNIGLTGAGHNTGALGAQSATNTTAYIVNPSNIMSSITIARSGATSTTRVSWEIVEYIGLAGGDNEMIVRSQTFLAYAIASTSATGTAVSGVVDDADVAVFITGQQNPDTLSTNYESGLNTSEWNATIDRPIIRRGVSGSDAGRVSYAVVEFTGSNWKIQRSQHTFTLAGVTETEAITALNSLSKSFIHVQKRNTTGLNGTDEFGAEVWLSSIGYVSYYLEPGATTPSGQTSVVWIIENTQNTDGAMVVTRSSGLVSGGTAPLAFSIPIGKTLSDITNASIFTGARSSVAGTTFTQSMSGVTIASTTAYELWRSNIGSTLTYRTEIVEWPTAGLALTQNYYRFFVDNNALLPTDPWPLGETSNLGENTVLTGADEPLGGSNTIRLRMSIQAKNATLPAEIRAFKLQYGAMVSSCSAISESNWKTLGNSASSSVWRGYSATGTTDGTLLTGNLILSVSDVAGTLEEFNDTSVNTNTVLVDEDIEYDWIIEQNGARAETFYCFRMVEADGTPLDTYAQYPQLRTASFNPRTQNWRWYDDEQNITPTTTLALENVSPTDIADGQALKLRVTVKEINNMSRDDVRFKLQYSEYANFSISHDVVATSTCIATSTWCYTNGGGIDNTKIASSTLSDSESCVGGVGTGCGTHNESPTSTAGFRHDAGISAEYEFSIVSAAPRVNRVYYFRLYDTVQGIPVVTNIGESYPSLATEGASLDFTMSGLASTTVVEGVTLDIDTTPTSLDFGSLAASTTLEGAHRLAVDTNGTSGYQLLMYMDGDLESSSGAIIKPITGTNQSPTSWNSGCGSEASSCFGYHTSDDTLDGVPTRFSAVDTYARVNTTTPEIVSYSSQPAISDSTDVIFRIIRRDLQDAGLYQARIIYITVPMF